MKLSISNIAWPQEEEKYFLSRIKEASCSGLEIAASRIWVEPVRSTPDQRRAYKGLINRHGLEISALQALLYTKQDMGLFKGKETEALTMVYLKELCRLAADLGARILVFGSPANRLLNGQSLDDAYEQAARFFYELGAEAERLGVLMCIEPLSTKYTDFINTGLEGVKLVEMVGSPGFGLHLDSAALAEESGDIVDTLKRTIHALRHFHISEPELAEIGMSGKVDHETMGHVLRELGYDGYVSIEMRTQPDYPRAVEVSLNNAKSLYLETNQNRCKT